MKLSTFILSNMPQILSEWDRFAKSLELDELLSDRSIRDHAKQILEAIAHDIDTYQSAKEQMEKSQGSSPDTLGTSGASVHGTARQNDGFTLIQLTAEYRALRASVQRLWFATGSELTQENSDDLIRFNEAIDQALAESVVTYSGHASRAKDTFLAILGHDLRSPLASISLAGSMLSQPGITKEGALKLAPRIIRSSSIMTSMVNDLLEYARAELGGEMPMSYKDSEMLIICQSAIADASAVHPSCPFQFNAVDQSPGSYDSVRLQQVFTNLLNNAAQYRGDELPVTMNMVSDANNITLTIQNSGAPIPKEAMDAIFDPMVQLAISDTQSERPSTSLGLGLYIAKKIVVAHGGTITVESNEKIGTTFTVIIPRWQNLQVVKEAMA